MDPQQWLVDWLIVNNRASKEDIDARLEANYFEMGWLDSLAFISFLAAVEEHFDISFDNGDFTDRSFSTIAGMAKRIESHL